MRGAKIPRVWPGAGAVVLLVLLRLLLSSGGPARGVSFSRAVFDRHGTLLRLTLSSDEKYRRFTPLGQMSPAAIEAILIREDRIFYYHPGLNPVALMKASRAYLAGSEGRGASTITMQLARLIFHLKTRSITGKFWQILAALYLELRYSKAQILEAYLNLIPLGHNIEGIPAASLIYFRKPPAQLNPIEAITLAVIPPRPSLRTTLSPVAKEEVRRVRKRLFAHWVERHPEDRHLAVEAEHAALPEDRNPLPFHAPHFTDSVLSASTTETEIHTSLDLPLELGAERVVREYTNERSSHGINNAAVLLIDAPSGEILVQVGSADYQDASIQGQVDGTRARRSPGSALKPFLYALAVDHGLIHSRTILKDAPVQFYTYSPENFEGEFLGPLPAESALVLSRNVPAIQLSARLKSPDLLDLLKSGGVYLPHSREYYGLAPVVGGVEVTMHELAAFYGALARGGRLRPTTFDVSGTSEPREIFSPQAAFLVMQMLRSGQSYGEEWMNNPLPIYWKTGTSSAFRDAWTAGIFGRYVLVVWVGNFDGSPNPAFVGRDAAAPLFFRVADLARSLDPAIRDLLAVPPGVTRIDVCAASGKMPRPFCPARAQTWFIPGKSPIEPCDVHREIVIDSDTGLRSCGTSSRTRKEVYEFWTSDIERLFRQAGVPRRTPPAFSPGCGQGEREASNATAAGGSIQITRPVRGVTYHIESEGEEIGFRAAAPSSSVSLFWFVDDAFVGSAPATDPVFWKARPGRFHLRVVDETGNSDRMDLRVSNAP